MKVACTNDRINVNFAGGRDGNCIHASKPHPTKALPAAPSSIVVNLSRRAIVISNDTRSEVRLHQGHEKCLAGLTIAFRIEKSSPLSQLVLCC